MGWTSPEAPDAVLAGAYAIPVVLNFADPLLLLPNGVAQDYARLQLLVAPASAALPENARALALSRGRHGIPSMQVVGEGPASLDAPIIEPPHRPVRTAAVPILMYHLVGPLPIRSQYSNEYSYKPDYGLTVPAAQFASEMQYLGEHGYHSISLVDLTDFLLYELPLPGWPVVLTFDDGFANEYEYALPVLHEEDLTATFFPCSGLIGEKSGEERYMSAAELARLSSGGFWVEDHTYNDGTSLWGQSQAEIRFLAASTASVLEAITSESIQFIAYSGLWPYPSPSIAGPGELELFHQLGGLGYVGGLEDNWVGRFPWRESSTDLWELPRVRAYPGEPTGVFAGLLNYG